MRLLALTCIRYLAGVLCISAGAQDFTVDRGEQRDLCVFLAVFITYLSFRVFITKSEIQSPNLTFLPRRNTGVFTVAIDGSGKQ